MVSPRYTPLRWTMRTPRILPLTAGRCITCLICRRRNVQSIGNGRCARCDARYRELAGRRWAAA